MTGEIRIDEFMHDYRWFYKAEVSFDMSRAVPVPFLSTSLGKNIQNQPLDPLRRHTLNPFPVGLTKGFLRRPDVIIVKNMMTRWPGRACADHNGIMHGDNLARVVEMKFPGDTLGRDQALDYMLIAGGKDRFTVLDVLERKKQTQPAPVPVPVPAPKRKRQDELKKVPIPIYSPQPVATPAHLEDWISHTQREFVELWHDAQKGLNELSQETRAWLATEAAWLTKQGQWVRHQTKLVWQWVNEKGQVISEWTEVQLKAMWRQIEEYCDIAWSEIKNIQWGQILLSIGKVLVSIVLVIGAVALIVITLPAELVIGFLACVGIMGGATVGLATA